jgi:hypothetical protein
MVDFQFLRQDYEHSAHLIPLHSQSHGNNETEAQEAEHELLSALPTFFIVLL